MYIIYNNLLWLQFVALYMADPPRLLLHSILWEAWTEFFNLVQLSLACIIFWGNSGG